MHTFPQSVAHRVDVIATSAGTRALADMLPPPTKRRHQIAVRAVPDSELPAHCRPSGGRGRIDFSRLDAVGVCLASEEERQRDAEWRRAKNKRPSVR